MSQPPSSAQPPAPALEGRVALITGAARRVGAAIARRLHGAGAQLMLHYRSAERDALALQAELNARRADSVALVQADLLHVGAPPELVKNTLARFGRLDVLVNNASSFYATPVGSIGEREWEDLMGTNLRVPLFLSQAAAPALKKSNGCIVNIVDIHSERPMKDYVVYNIAKSGLAGLTRVLARELGPEVRVNGVSPGAVMWPEDDLHFDAVSRQRIVSNTPLKRAGDPDDIAGAVLYFAAGAPFVTGQILAVDGGRSIHI
ncbi:MAG: pteridine reductase [Betaproteobacteria bacterium]|nr:pteridine reductase [Betaproteobacteria bacterium]